MQFIQTNNLPSFAEPNHHIETPTKKTKKEQQADFNTADSIALTDTKSSSLIEIDPQQLFERFHEIIKISEVDEEEDEQVNPQSVYRKLDYEANHKKAIKLDFSPENSSMTKKNKISNGKCLASQAKRKQLFEMMRINSPVKRSCIVQNEVQSASMNQKVESTPMKLTKAKSHCQMAARKESPYRDLTNHI